jgi:hypothetical protein
MALLLHTLNNLIPFTDPATPLWRDILHSALLCTFLYLAPKIQWHRIADGFWWIGSKIQLAETQQRPPDPAQLEARGLVEQLEGQELELFDSEDEEQAQEAQHEEGLFVQQDEEAAPAAPIHQNGGPQAQAGPANPPVDGAAQQPHQPQRRRDLNKPVGAKKQKSLARREQIRQYHEFQRQQAELQRAQDAEGAAEREAAQAAERERRRKVEEKIQQEKTREREARRREEERAREKEEKDRRTALDMVSERLSDGSGLLSFGDVAKTVGRDVVWVENIVRREGLLGTKDVSGKRTLTVITKHGWLARIDANLMKEVYERAAKWDGELEHGIVSWEDLGYILAEVLRDR